MDTKTVKSGDLLARREGLIENIWYIADGTVSMSSDAVDITLKKGDFIGIIDIATGMHSYDYTATSTTQLVNFATRDSIFQSDFCMNKPENARALAMSMNHIIRELYVYIHSLCSRTEELNKLIEESYSAYCDYAGKMHISIDEVDSIDDYSEPVMLGFNQKYIYQMHRGVYSLLSNKDSGATLVNSGAIPGYMLHAIDDFNSGVSSIEYISSVVEELEDILINRISDSDLISALGRLLVKATPEHPLFNDIEVTMNNIYSAMLDCGDDRAERKRDKIHKKIDNLNALNETEANESEFFDIFADESDTASAAIMDSMHKIFDYAQFPKDRADALAEAIESYKKLDDPYVLDENARYIRNIIEDNFYALYLGVLEAYLESEDHPTIIKMFLEFGYLDEELAGIQNAYQLYNIAKTYEGDRARGIYTGFEWLLAIFTQDKAPSINEFGQTFEEYINEQLGAGRIPQDKLKLYLKDRGQMVMFELQNMFRRASKMCSGHVANFCPVFCEHQLMRGLDTDVIDPRALLDSINQIKSMDYSLFYRETVFVYDKKENIHDHIHVEILPDIVMLPVVGSRGAMWQEIVGRDRMTPGRMIFPIVCNEDLGKLMLRVVAEYRWEMCKRVQGMRWNDVTDPSLTSLYYDYLQFYKKNSDISTEQKEKIKLGLQRSKQNFKEYFINDYAEYIKFETLGSPHLTKVARYILITQCPLAATVRNKLSDNPIYTEVLDKYRIKTAQHLHRLDNIKKKLVSKGINVPGELEREIKFYAG